VAIAARYKGYRYPIEVIGHAVWLYHRFALSLRDVEELMVPRCGGHLRDDPVLVCEVRAGLRARLRRRRPRPGEATSGTWTRCS
jgi:putative transposase